MPPLRNIKNPISTFGQNLGREGKQKETPLRINRRRSLDARGAEPPRPASLDGRGATDMCQLPHCFPNNLWKPEVITSTSLPNSRSPLYNQKGTPNAWETNTYQITTPTTRTIGIAQNDPGEWNPPSNPDHWKGPNDPDHWKRLHSDPDSDPGQWKCPQRPGPLEPPPTNRTTGRAPGDPGQ